MTKQENKFRTESHQGRTIEFSLDERGLLGIEFDDYPCTYRYMSKDKARELAAWLNRTLADEPSAPDFRALLAELYEAGDAGLSTGLAERIDRALNRPAELSGDRPTNTAYEANIAELEPDAERYRWLKRHHLQTGQDSWIRTGDDLEEAIDEGRRAENRGEKHG